MMKLAMAQMAMSKDMEANFQKSYDFVRQAAGADLIFFPEVQHMPFLPQYEAAELPEKLGKKRDDYLLRPDDAHVTAFNELARQSQCMVSPNLYLQYGGQAPGYAHPVPRRGKYDGLRHEGPEPQPGRHGRALRQAAEEGSGHLVRLQCRRFRRPQGRYLGPGQRLL